MKNSEIYEEVLEMFEPKIKKSLLNTHFQEREDLEQEIKIKIYEKIDVLNDMYVPGFFEFIEQGK
ncbi:helix-turn-helix domain-containing protein [Priestia megaterium]|uniref:helix-turn-helix domain-containing protein n=1 Tax=Priestia megaterium TaxID=1404 RepID=UPI0012B6D6F9|nr:helix-turn-helix domain-containing protein [Priestia megaterium]QSX24144.1 helix-turn-helix domain-containing protein [Priestia megaterium]